MGCASSVHPTWRAHCPPLLSRSQELLTRSPSTCPPAFPTVLSHPQELTRSPSPVTRNNILVALADMVTHYTGMGDCHVPRLAACVVDPHPLVRSQVGPSCGPAPPRAQPGRA